MNKQELRIEFYKRLMEWQDQAVSPDNLGGDRYCEGGIIAWRICYRLTKKTFQPETLLARLERLRNAWAIKVDHRSSKTHDRACQAALAAVEEAISLLKKQMTQGP